MTKSSCLNCGAELSGQFCKTCGQSTRVRKIDLSYLTSEALGILQLNRGFLFSLKELFTRPGDTIREYLQGKRRSHTSPVALVLTLSSIYLIGLYFLGGQTHLGDAFAAMLEGWNDAGGDGATEAGLERVNWAFQITRRSRCSSCRPMGSRRFWRSSEPAIVIWSTWW